MIAVRVYALPLRQGAALCIPISGLDDLRRTASLLAVHPAPLRLDILVSGEAASKSLGALNEQAEALLRHAAVVALTPDSDHTPLPGPAGRWLTTLVFWGLLMLLEAGQSAVFIVSGLWLAFGVRWARGRLSARIAAERSRLAGAVAWALPPAETRAAPHAGLSALRQVLATKVSVSDSVYWDLAEACPRAGLGEFAGFYTALANGERPAGVWAWLAEASPAPGAEAAAPDASAAHLASVDTVNETGAPEPSGVHAMDEADNSEPRQALFAEGLPIASEKPAQD